jgi:predicted CxxxxCH...CXXCH cytochrome family protein
MKYVKVILALILVGLVVVACDTATPAPPTTAPPAQAPTVPLPTLPPPLPTNTPVPANTPVPPTPTPKALAPSAELRIVPVAANRGSGIDKGDPNVMTTTIKVMTDTVAGPYSSVIALGAPGLNNASLGVPVHLSVADLDAKNPAKKIAWTLTAPTDSKAKLLAPDKAATEFSPDVVGIYKVDVVLSNDAGSSPMQSVQIHVGTYVGVDAGNCTQCHPNKVAEWSKTGHASRLTNSINDKAGTYSETCIRCHTTGYFPGANNGGFADVQAKLTWQFPTVSQLKAGQSWDKMPAELKNMANIQCEDCHGPAKEHVTQGQPVMDTSFDEGVCNVCHNGGGHHLKGTDLKSAKHSNGDSIAFNDPVGPSRRACVRCHSGKGYASFLADPKNMASWNNEKQTITCTTCHDPHSEENAFQLRIVGKAVEVPFQPTTDYGLSATCVECNRRMASWWGRRPCRIPLSPRTRRPTSSCSARSGIRRAIPRARVSCATCGRRSRTRRTRTGIRSAHTHSTQSAPMASSITPQPARNVTVMTSRRPSTSRPRPTMTATARSKACRTK